MRATTLLLVCLALIVAVNCYSFTASGTVQVGTGTAWPATIKVSDVSHKVQIDYDFGVTELELYDQQSRYQICPATCKNYFLSNPLPAFNYRQGGVNDGGQMRYTSPSDNGYVTTIWTVAGVPVKIQQVGDGYKRVYTFTTFTLNTPTFDAAPSSCQQVQCGQALDLMLVIDSSGSISPSDYIIEMDYAQQVIDSFTIGTYGVHAGLVTFATDALLRSTLTDNKAALTNVINNAAQQQGETNIGAAINMAAAEFQSRARPGVPKVIILLTDGKANRPTDSPINFMINAANNAKSAGILIYAIGVGSLVQQSDLNDIASAPTSDYTSLVGNFAALQTTINNILRQVCVGGETDGCNPSCYSDTQFCGCGSCLCVGSDALSCGNRGTWNQAACSCTCTGNWASTSGGHTCSRCTITGCSNSGTYVNNPSTGECGCQCRPTTSGLTCQNCDLDCPGASIVNNCGDGTCKCPSNSHATLASNCLTCRNDYCKNGGTSKAGCLGCNCVDGWEGDDCTQCNWECSHGFDYVATCNGCACDYPWGGDDCDNCIRVCQHGTLNAATCTCTCDPGFAGLDCDTCSGSYCKHSGTITTVAQGCTCNCPPSIYWGGPACDTCILTCAFGTLKNTNGECRCECPSHLTGARCDQCNTNYCKHSSTQGVYPSGCSNCQCTGLWTGNTCDDCSLDNTGANPRCSTGVPNQACTGCICPTRTFSGVQVVMTTGTYCDTCNSALCIHGSITPGSFPNCRCTCDPGFAGERCDTCISTLCSNNGTPKPDGTCSSCNCVDNWTGTFCDRCELVCQNGGVLNEETCRCECAHFWEGDDCSDCDNVDPDFCDECSYNGVLNEDCTLCICDEWHTGEICDECKFTCGPNGERSEDCRTCECYNGWIGTDCTVCDTSINSVFCNGRGTVTNPEDGCSICTCENFWGLDDCSECTIDCNGNGEPNEDCTACVCENSWSEVDNCLTCDLDCNDNGEVNDDCTACVCDGGYTGRLCNVCDSSNYLPRCINDVGPLTEDCECNCLDQWSGRYCNECNLSALNCENGDIIDYQINGVQQCRCRCYNNWIGEECNECGFLDEDNPLYQCPDISIPVLTDCSCHCPEYYTDIEGCDECIITNEDCVHEDPNSTPDLTKGVCACICLGNWSGRTCAVCDPALVLCEDGWELDTEICECVSICGDDLIVGEEQCEVLLIEDDVDQVCCQDCYFDEDRPCDDLRTCTRFDFCEVFGSEIVCQGSDRLNYTVDASREFIPLGVLTENYWARWGITVTSSVSVSIVDTRTLGYPSTNPCGGDIVFDRVLVATNSENNAQLCFNMAEPIEVQSVSVINNSKEPGASNSFRIDFYCTNTIGPITVDARNYGPGSVEFIRNPCTGFLVTKICYRNFPTGAIGPLFFCDDNNYNLGRLGDYVWYDINVDNIQDANELPVPGVPVKLYEGTTNRYLAITYTNEDGLYIFEYLYNGQYSVEFNAPVGYTYSTPVRYPYDNMLHYGTLDNNLITDTVKEILTVDVGIYLFGAIGDYIFYDVSQDGIQNEASSYAVSGVRLDLYRDDDRNTIIATKYTDALGNYLFYPLPVYETASTYHSYYVQMTPPVGSTVTLRFSGNDRTVDANFDRNTYWSDIIPLTPTRPFDLTIDGGIYYCCGSVGDRVWIDTKTTDGIQNSPSEDNAGVPNVRVTLYHNGVATASQLTNSVGNYLFTGLQLSGTYYVHFDQVPGYVLTEKSKGTNRELDSDANPNGDTDTFYLTRERPDRLDIDAGLKIGCTTAAECVSGNACQTAICNAANQCEYTNTVVCNPLNDPCVEPVCQPSTGLCLPVPKISTVPIPCEDNDICTIGDVCVGGTCKGTPTDGPAFTCDDNDTCTSNDYCVEGECKGTPCVETTNPCFTTICDATGCKDVPAPGTPCNDNNLCTERDVCDATGVCGGTPKPCTNNEYCKEYTCDPGTGRCKSRITPDVPCSDGSPCTENDTCDSRGRCNGTAIVCTGTNPCLNYFCSGGQCQTSVKSSSTTCNDNNDCTEGDRCQPDASCAGTPKNCDDRKVCTTDTCEAGQCVHRVAEDATCSDSNLCNTEVCDAVTGNCVSTPINCDDGKVCTLDRCVNGECFHYPTGDSCNDNDLCTVYDACDIDGTCKGTRKNCDDGNICTDDSCNPTTGACEHVNNEKPCDDGTECSDRSYCTDGQCIGYDIVQCFTTNPCAIIECDGVTGSCIEGSKPDGSVCQTNDLCRLNGVCEQGECQGRETTCDDNNPCTVDTCNSENGRCVFTHTSATNNIPCNDGNKCTTQDVCIYDAGFNLSRCYGTEMECDDGNICTLDFCNIITGECDTEPTDSTVTCDDGDKCTRGDVCVEGNCSGSSVLCTPAGVCKESECNPATGECEVSITEGESCNDGIVCTSGDVCDAEGNCAGEHTCDNLVHPNPCKDYLCSDSGDCIIVNVADSTPCNDGNACTQTDVCILGRCTGTNPFPCTSDVCNRRECVDREGTPTCSTTFTQNTCGNSVGCHDFICSAGTCTTVVNRNCNAGNTNPCTRRFCAADGTCSEENITGPCEDGDPCTANTCVDGSCQVTGSVPNCRECESQDDCPAPANCFHYECRNNECILSADSCTPSTNPCIAVVCDPATDVCTPRKLVNTRCDDSNRCTSNDICVSTGSGAEDIVCRGSEVSCQSRVCQVGTCNPDNGQCSYRVTEGETCNDGVSCTESDVCDSEANCRGTPITCNDGNTCTDDVCVEGRGCQNTNNERVCTDGNACTSNDRCIQGTCVGQSQTACPESTDPCKRNVCDPINGCVSVPVPDETECGEEDICFDGPAVCRGGVCILPERTSCPAPIDPQCPLVCVNNECVVAESTTCDDNDACTVQDRCRANGQCIGVRLDCSDLDDGCVEGVCFNGACVERPVAGATTCDDGDACTVNVCKDGECQSTPVTCSSNNPCEQFRCDKDRGCVAFNNPVSCTPVNGIVNLCKDYICVDRACKEVEPTVTCNDDNPCTNDQCFPETGECVHTPNDLLTCSDNDPCTIDTCLAGTCTSTPKVCEDNNVCTDDICIGGVCVYNSNQNTCPYSSGCITGGICSNQVCVPNTFSSCSTTDVEECQDVTCDRVTGSCVVTTITDSVRTCNDGDSCTTGDVCTPLGCRGTPLVCNPTLEECKESYCLNGVCELRANDNLVCNSQDTACATSRCEAGECVRNSEGSRDCSDTDNCTYGNVCTEDGCEFTEYSCILSPCVYSSCTDDGFCSFDDTISSWDPLTYIAFQTLNSETETPEARYYLVAVSTNDGVLRGFTRLSNKVLSLQVRPYYGGLFAVLARDGTRATSLVQVPVNASAVNVFADGVNSGWPLITTIGTATATLGNPDLSFRPTFVATQQPHTYSLYAYSRDNRKLFSLDTAYDPARQTQEFGSVSSTWQGYTWDNHGRFIFSAQDRILSLLNVKEYDPSSTEAGVYRLCDEAEVIPSGKFIDMFTRYDESIVGATDDSAAGKLNIFSVRFGTDEEGVAKCFSNTQSINKSLFLNPGAPEEIIDVLAVAFDDTICLTAAGTPNSNGGNVTNSGGGGGAVSHNGGGGSPPPFTQPPPDQVTHYQGGSIPGSHNPGTTDNGVLTGGTGSIATAVVSVVGSSAVAAFAIFAVVLGLNNTKKDPPQNLTAALVSTDASAIASDNPLFQGLAEPGNNILA